MDKLINRILKLLQMAGDLINLLFNYRRAKKIAEKSLLFSRSIQEKTPCPLCGEARPQLLINFPLGWPMPQNDHLLYYEYSDDRFSEVLKARNLLFRTAGFFLRTRWDFCPKCRNVIFATKFSDSHLNEYYAKYYKRLAKPSPKRRAAKEPYAKYVDSLVGENSHLLEFGSAEGYAANYLAMRGHKVTVVEPSGFREIVMQNQDIAVCGDINSLPKGRFDCIYLHHVLEHFSDPASFFILAKNLLKENGLLVIQVPDISIQMQLYILSLRLCHYALINPVEKDNELLSNYFLNGNGRPYYWMDALGNNHLYAFTLFGLEYLLRKNRFKIKKMKQTMKNDLRFDKDILAWPVDNENGQTPNGLTIVAQR
ncbi:MAG: hypothetical protein COV72_03390 [Candidatus Omnitrophica bacterium CG11_big_fil_rev_8_21_14_0_20_42_13]|uniref:Methyltransferase type 11 n=1 Tax=Candidatus Ghiorseimicrobium undicola TaxID=1974746 RepID=A0A2H0LY90_9BACT|nr:MAG: hypothetical protein COV72_03390 [Candidatus Omnitrophica bacterium CG11_big_fil_rev_8_21_14_0_20_42_13]